MRLKGLPPLANADSRVLILGSFPGEISLLRQEYYAHERNSFWKILCLIHKPGLALNTYNAKKMFLQRNGLAVWDVIGTCERETSADSKIRNARTNDFKSFLVKYPGIRMILLNGRIAETTWRKEVSGVTLPAVYVPSTSPALAALSLKAKTSAWQQALRF